MLERKKSLNGEGKIVVTVYSMKLRYYNIPDKLKAFKGYKLQLSTLGYIVDQGRIEDKPFLANLVHKKINKNILIKHCNVRQLVYSCILKGKASPRMLADLKDAKRGLSANSYQVEFKRLLKVYNRKGLELNLESY